eukprot:SAG31_NODE_3767_length_3902_cov_1.591375_8_plen_28_part_01
MVQLIGVNRRRDSWPLMKDLGVLWIRDG